MSAVGFRSGTVADVLDDAVNVRVGTEIVGPVPNFSPHPLAIGDSVTLLTDVIGRTVCLGSPSGPVVVPDPDTTFVHAAAAPVGTGWVQASSVYFRVDGSRVTEVHLVQSAPPPAPTSSEVVVKPIGSQSWRDGAWISQLSPEQGYGYYGNTDMTGLWWYSASRLTPLRGKTITSARFRVRRSAGTNGPMARVTVGLRLTPHAERPAVYPTLLDTWAVASLTRGAQTDIDLPASWRTKLSDGSASGFAVTGSGTSQNAEYTAVGDDSESGLLICTIAT